MWKNHHGSATRDLPGRNETLESDDADLCRSGATRFGQGERAQMCVTSLILWGVPFGEVCHLLMLLLFDPLVLANLLQWTHLPPSLEKAVVSIDVCGSGSRDADPGSSVYSERKEKGRSVSKPPGHVCEETKYF